MTDQKYIGLLAEAKGFELLLPGDIDVAEANDLIARLADAIRELTGAAIEAAKPQANPDWGYYLEDGKTFITVAKVPLQNAGHEKPPFTITRPDGKTLNIIEKPDTAG